MRTKISGIYSITNTINGKIYYGSSNNIEKRWKEHQYQLVKNKHANHYLQTSWNKYGESIFKFEIVKEVPVDQLLDKEQTYLDIAKKTPQLFYNINYDAEAPMRGRHHSEETLKKMSIVKMGTIHSEESKQKMIGVNKGIKSGRYGKPAWNSGKKGLQVPWNKGKRGVQVAWNKGLKSGNKYSKNSG